MSHWIIQDKIFGEETDELIKHLLDYDLVKEIPENAPKDSVIRGSLDFVELYQNKFPNNKQWVTLSNYDCSFYYPLVDNLLNEDHIFANWGDLVLDKERIFSEFDTESCFIRPNSGRKIFTGTTLTKKWWDQELKIIEELPNSCLLYTSPSPRD